MIDTFHAYGVLQPGARLQPWPYQVGALAPEEVQIRVESCGLCHSDLSMIDDAWGRTVYPLVPGHEVVGIIEAVGDRVVTLAKGQRVGLGWYSGSCMHCRPCVRGRQDHCEQLERTIIGRHGGFADRVRCHWSWAIALPETIDPLSAGPLFCSGLTVFAPIIEFAIKPTDCVGVIGLGGLGHLAVQIFHKWGCHVTVFTSTAAKAADAIQLGAHEVVDSRDPATRHPRRRLDFILSTVNVDLDWNTYLDWLAPGGRLHFVGIVRQPISIAPVALIGGGKQLSGSALGSPEAARTMLEFCERHRIAPWVESFPMASVNEAIDRLRAGNNRYRIVLTC